MTAPAKAGPASRDVARTVPARTGPERATRSGGGGAEATALTLQAQAGNRAVARLLAGDPDNPVLAVKAGSAQPPLVLRQVAAPPKKRARAKPAKPAAPPPSQGSPTPEKAAPGEVEADEAEAEAGSFKAPDEYDHKLLRSIEVATRIAKLKKEGKAKGPEVARLLDLVPWDWIDAKNGMVRADIGNVLLERWLPARAKQIAFKMLDESEQVARREQPRYSGREGLPDAQALRAAAAPLAAAEKNAKDLMSLAQGIDGWGDAQKAQAEFEALKRAYGSKFPVLLSPAIDYEALAGASDYDVHRMATGAAGEVVANIEKSRKHLKKGEIDFWDLGPVIGRVKEHYGIEPGSYVDQLIERERKSRARSSLIANIASAVLQIGLGIVAVFTTGGTALIALVAGAGLSTAQAVGHLAEYEVKTATSGSSLDAARALSSDKPGLIWLALDVVGAVLDLAAAVKLFRTMAEAAEDLARLEQIARAEAKALESQGKLKGTVDHFVERLMKSAKAARGAQGRRAKAIAEMLKGSGARVVSLLAGEEKALLGLLKEWGSWKELLGMLEHGNPAMRSIGTQLVDYRRAVVSSLGRPVAEGGVGGRLLGGASSELISDVDIQVASGRLLIEAEKQMANRFGPRWSELFRMSFYTEAGRLYKYADVMKLLPKAARAALQKQLTVLSERLNFAKMLRHAGKDKDSVARVERLIKQVVTDEKELAEIRKLAAVSERAGLAKRNELLVEIDDLMAEFATATKQRQLELAEQITQKQMEANHFTKEAYISPGAAREAAESIKVIGPEAYQSSLAQLEMIEHVLHEVGGDVVKAAREYELFKYINRFAAAAQRAGLKTKQLTYFEHLSEYIYRVYRGGHAEIPTGLPDDWLRRPFVRPSDGASFAVPRVGDDFLRKQFDEFQAAAEGALPKLRSQAMSRSDAWAPGAEATAKKVVEVAERKHTPNPTNLTKSGELPKPKPSAAKLSAAEKAAPAAKAAPPAGRLPYRDLNSKSTDAEKRVGELLNRDLTEYREVYGAKEVKKAKDAVKGTRSGDYRGVRPDGSEVRLDLYEPSSARMKNIMDKILDKNSQADVVVVDLGKGGTASWGIKEAEELAGMLFSTPSHDIKQLIFVKGGAIIGKVPPRLPG